MDDKTETKVRNATFAVGDLVRIPNWGEGHVHGVELHVENGERVMARRANAETDWIAAADVELIGRVLAEGEAAIDGFKLDGAERLGSEGEPITGNAAEATQPDGADKPAALDAEAHDEPAPIAAGIEADAKTDGAETLTAEAAGVDRPS